MNSNGKTLRDKALLVKFSTTQWIGEKFDKKVTQEVETIHHTSNAGRFNKALLAREALLKSKQARNAARTFVYTQTLPWTDEGWRMLPSLNYLEFTKGLQKLTQEIKAADTEVFNNYEAAKEEARQRMNSLFNPKDYPDLDTLKDKFTTGVEYRGIPEATDIRVDIDPEELKAIDERVKEATQQAITDLWERLYNNVKHMSDKLGEKDAIFRDTLVNNLKDLCSLLPRLNVTNDPNLEAMRQQIEARLTNIEADDLRPRDTDRPIDKAMKEANRKQTAQEAKAILDSMEAYFTPCRKEA